MDQGNKFENFDRSKISKLGFWLSWWFFPFTVLALFFDSTYFDNQFITTILSIIFLGLLFKSADNYLRKLLFVMIFLSYLGEIIFCKILEMYAYRDFDIPLYVPIGHAIVYGCGFIMAKNTRFGPIEKKLQIFFPVFFAVLFLVVFFWFDDVFSLVFGILFFILLKRKKFHFLYYFIAFNVIFIELAGTYFGCWTWKKITLGFFQTANPPLGAVFFYAGGDILLAKIVTLWENKKTKLRY